MREIRHKLLRRLAESALLAAMVVAASGCDDESRGAEPTLAGGTCIVDYGVSDGMAARGVSHTAVAPNERIKSLTYLLYDQDGNFVKRREIPDMDKMEAGDWPMRRETMTWAQREALKDTLECGMNYTALFIANASPTLFNGEQVLTSTERRDGKEVEAPIDKVYLTLPKTEAFSDNNMFYLSVCPINSSGHDRNNHVNCDVMLERIVSRTDFFADYEDWESEATKAEVRVLSDKLFDRLFSGEYLNKRAETAVEWAKSFTSAFYTQSLGHQTLDGIFVSWVADFARNMNEVVDYASILRDMDPEDKANIKDLLYEQCRANTQVKNHWRQWRGSTARVGYGRVASRFYVWGRVSDNSATSADYLSPALDISTLPGTGTRPEQFAFTLIGFGENPGAETASTGTLIKEVRLYENATASTSYKTIAIDSDKQTFPDQGGNERVKLRYYPVKEFTHTEVSDNSKQFSYRLKPMNMKPLLPSSLFIADDYPGYLQEFFDSDKNPGKKYGTSIERFVIEIRIPDMSTDALGMVEQWIMENG